ncbi:acetamidase/formamidase family protein [Leeia oryzae]|uniref:acetamidase/formamidase family protein n=1 Tax=Leeia oryzae TaxID=356662 RepID=UPI0003656CBC|nr:acetamidase/formamidase family protein [Leeia oryzae]
MTVFVQKTDSVYAMSRENPAVVTVKSGTVVQLETCDCFGDQIQTTDTPFGELDWGRINPATGPVYVEEAKAGDVLCVEIQKIDVAQQAVMVTAPNLGVTGDMHHGPEIHIVPITDGMALLPGGVQWPIKPMIGVIGTAPAGEPVSCGIPDAHGGNMDCKVIAEGATLYLPVNVDGALFALGDLHAAMGDGEVSVCGLEIQGKVTVRLSVIKERALPTPMVKTADAIYTIASAKLLDDAANMAARNMAGFITRHTRLSLSEAVSLLSICGDLQICQVVDPQKTCRFALPLSVARQLDIQL